MGRGRVDRDRGREGLRGRTGPGQWQGLEVARRLSLNMVAEDGAGTG